MGAKKLRVSICFSYSFRNRAIYRILCLMRIQALDALLCGCNQKKRIRQTDFSHKELSIYRIPNDSMPITIFKQILTVTWRAFRFDAGYNASQPPSFPIQFSDRFSLFKDLYDHSLRGCHFCLQLTPAGGTPCFDLCGQVRFTHYLPAHRTGYTQFLSLGH